MKMSPQERARQLNGTAEGAGPFIVRLYDGMDNQWMDVSAEVGKEEAERIWNEKTKDGTQNTKFDDIDYYKICPAGTKMLFSEGFGENVR